MLKKMISFIIIHWGVSSILTIAIFGQDKSFQGKILTPEVSPICQKTEESWTSLDLNKGQIVTLAIAPSNPRTIYSLVQNKFIFKSTKSGSQWKRLDRYPDTTNIRTIAVDPTSPNIVYVVEAAG